MVDDGMPKGDGGLTDDGTTPPATRPRHRESTGLRDPLFRRRKSEARRASTGLRRTVRETPPEPIPAPRDDNPDVASPNVDTPVDPSQSGSRRVVSFDAWMDEQKKASSSHYRSIAGRLEKPPVISKENASPGVTPESPDAPGADDDGVSDEYAGVDDGYVGAGDDLAAADPDFPNYYDADDPYPPDEPVAMDGNASSAFDHPLDAVLATQYGAGSSALINLRNNLIYFISLALDNNDLKTASEQLPRLVTMSLQSDPETLDLFTRFEELNNEARKKKRAMWIAAASGAGVLVVLLVVFIVLNIGAGKKVRRFRAEMNTALQDTTDAREALSVREDRIAELDNARRDAVESQRRTEEKLAKIRNDLNEAIASKRRLEQDVLALKNTLRDTEKQIQVVDQKKQAAISRIQRAKETEKQARALADQALANKQKAFDALLDAKAEVRNTNRKLAALRIQRAMAAIGSDRNFQLAETELRRAVKTMPDDDSGTARRLLDYAGMALPRLTGERTMPGGALRVYFSKDGTPHAILDSGAIWTPGVPDGELPAGNVTLRFREAVIFGGVVVAVDAARKLFYNGYADRIDSLAGQDITALAADSTGKWLVVGTQAGKVFVFTAGLIDTPVYSGEAHRGAVTHVAFLKTGARVASVGADDYLCVSDYQAGKQVVKTRVFGSRVTAMAVSPGDGRIVLGYDDGAMRVWSAKGLSDQGVIAGRRGAVRGLAYAPSGCTLASVDSGGRLALWDCVTPEDPLIATLSLSRQVDASSPAFSPDGKTLAFAGDDGQFRTWDISDKMDATPGKWRAASVSGTRLFLVAGVQPVLCGSSQAYDFLSGGAPKSRWFDSPVACIFELGEKKNTTALLQNGVVVGWDTGDSIAKLPAAVGSVSVQGGYLVVAGSDSKIYLAALWRNAFSLDPAGEIQNVAGVAVTGDGTRIAVWTQAGELYVGAPGALGSIRLGDDIVRQAVFSEDGLKIIVRTDSPDLLVVNPDSGEVIRRVACGNTPISCMILSTDGKWLATGAVSGRFTLWTMPDFYPMVLATRQEYGIVDIKMDDDMRYAYSLLNDSSVRRFNIPQLVDPDAIDIHAAPRAEKSRKANAPSVPSD